MKNIQVANTIVTLKNKVNTTRHSEAEVWVEKVNSPVIVEEFVNPTSILRCRLCNRLNKTVISPPPLSSVFVSRRNITA